MGKKITQYSNFVSINPDNNSLMDISEKTGTSIYESRKWTLTAFKAWVNSWVVASSIAWADITGKPTTISGYGITDAVDTTGGTANYVAKFTDANTIEESQIRDNGSTISVNTALDADIHFKLSSDKSTASEFVTSCSSATQNMGVRGWAVGTGSGPTITNYGIFGIAQGATNNIGGHFSSDSVGNKNIGISSYVINGITNHSAQLRDGTEAIGKILKSATNDGKTNWAYLPYDFPFAVSDETTALTAGTNKVSVRLPRAMVLTSVRASLVTAQTSGSIFTVDINQDGTSILSTKLTIDNTEKTSKTAVTAPVLSTTSLTDDAEITVDIDQIGDGTAKGLKIYLIGYILL